MSTTRLVLLGVVRIFQPAYGYQLRRELLTWNVQDWANINPGSIYTGLRTLAKHGYLLELEDGTEGAKAGRTSYKLTTDGETEYLTQLRAALWTVRPFHPDQMQAALNFVSDLQRDEVIAALEARIAQFEQHAKHLRFAERQITENPAMPNHVLELMRINHARAQGEQRWTREFMARVRDGEYSFAGEPPDWQMPADVVTHWDASNQR